MASLDWLKIASSADILEKMAGAIKQATKLTGLDVCKNPKYVLTKYYRVIMSILKKMPENAAYRKHTESIVKHRSYIVNSTEDIQAIEAKIGCGEIEEVILQAKNELALAETLLMAKPWNRLVSPIPKDQWKWPAK